MNLTPQDKKLIINIIIGYGFFLSIYAYRKYKYNKVKKDNVHKVRNIKKEKRKK